MKRERVRGYGDTKKRVTFKDNIIVLGLCVICIAVIAITFYISNLDKGNGKTQVSQNRTDETDTKIEDYEEVVKNDDETTNTDNENEDIEKAEDATETVNEDEVYGTESVITAGAKVVTLAAPIKGSLIKEHSNTELVYSKTLEDWRIHRGIDIGAKIGTTVCASADGVVEETRNDIMYGNTIVIDHGNNMKTVYCNLTGTNMVQKGKTIEKGEPIGMVGDSAICETSDEAHLHFEVLVDGNYVNPLNYFTL